MGTNNLGAELDGDTADAADVNQYRDALIGDIVPRNTSGNPEANAGEAGTSTYPFERINVTTGGLFPGALLLFHDFGGALTPAQGYMKCNGDIVNETNYDAIHGAGSWAAHIVSSPLSGKHLPDWNNKYAVGSDTTPDDGSSAISPVGNANHQVNLQHNHSIPGHNHRWYIPQGSSDDNIFDSSGTQHDIANAGRTGLAISVGSGGGLANSNNTMSALYTSNAGSGNTGNAGSTTQNIQPESQKAQYWIRII